jgi:DNA primase
VSYGSLEEAILYGYEFERQYVCHAHNDHNASASVNAVSGWFFCYACGHRGRIDPETVEISDEGFHRMVLKMTSELEAKERPEAWLNTFDATGPGDYWLSRFSERTCRFYRLGHAPEIGTYPMRDNVGRVLGVVSRDLTGNREQKYLYPWGVSISKYLIDFHRMTSDTLILVEGMSDVAAVYEAGFHCAIGCYRNGLSAAQVKLLLKYDPRKVLVGFDQDSGGEIGWQRVRKVLGGQVSLHRMWWKGYKDLAAIPLEERREMLTEMLDNESVTMVDTVSTLDRLGA